MRETIKEILIRRDGMEPAEADELIKEATDQLEEYVNDGYLGLAEEICQEFFGLEPDYLDELMPI